MSTFQLSFKTKLGFVSIIERDGYITDINFRKVVKKKASLQLLKVRDQIKKFLNKKIKRFTFKTKTIGSKAQLQVWNQIKKINYGKIVSYNYISKKTKIHPRHVGRICGENKLLLFIPCHRVIRSDGLLGGFSTKHGVNLKNKILKIEESNK